MQLWVRDPKTKQPSVSLTMLVISFIAVMIAAFIHMMHVIDDTSVLIEIFYANVGLYFGRRVQISKTGVNAETNNDQQDQSK